MNCNLSKKTCTHPVLLNGLIYEKSTLEKYMLDFKKAPDGSEVQEFQEIKIKNNIPTTTHSVPNILMNLQNEFDAVVIESYEIKRKYQELSTQYTNALYELDAAKRVIARLVKERETFKDLKITAESIKNVEKQPEMQVEFELPAEVLENIDNISVELSTKRRAKITDFATPDEIKALTATDVELKGTVSHVDIFNSLILVTLKDGI